MEISNQKLQSPLNNPNPVTNQNLVYNINTTHNQPKGVSMTTISKRTELSRLIRLGLIDESQIATWNKRLARLDAKYARETEMKDIEKQVLSLMTQSPDARFKTGKLVKTIGFETESDRVTLHGKVGRALKSLAAQGKITRYNFTQNNTHAFYSLDSEIQPPVKETETETELVTPADITSAE